MEMNFCRRCGGGITRERNHTFRCTGGHTLFANSSPTVGIFLINNDNQLLMTVRGIEPHKGTLDLVGGFLDPDETLELAVYRELEEETGLSAADISEPQYLLSTVNDYTYSGEELPVMGVIFWARLISNTAPIPRDDVSAFQVCAINDLGSQNLYPGNILTASRKLRNILEQ